MPITPFIHVTVAFSNAVLTAILPHISDFAQKLDLPVPQPITMSQVARFRPSNMQGFVGGGLRLTNGYSFGFGMGYVDSFSAPHNYYHDPVIQVHWPPDLSGYYGDDNMTTNEAIEMARDAFRKLGYKPEDFHVDGPPSSVNGPRNLKDGNHIPFCKVHWDSPESVIQAMLGHTYNIGFEIDMQRKQLVGMNLSSRDFFRPDPKIDVVPELESDYRKRMRAAGMTNFVSPWVEMAEYYRSEYLLDTNPPPKPPETTNPPTLQSPPASSGITNAPVVQPPKETKKQVPPAEPFIHVAADYSNEMLRATLPLVSDFARKLDLPVVQPLTASQVVTSHPSDIKDLFVNFLILTNHYWFMVANGYVLGFGSPDNWFEEKATRTDWPHYYSKDCMTTNEAVELARSSFRRLGYKPEAFHLDKPPTSFENAYEDEYGKKEPQYAYCRISWDGTDREHDEGFQFDIDMRGKRVVGMALSSTNFGLPSPKLDVVPELESDYQKRNQMHMFVRTNTPPSWPLNQATNIKPTIPPAGGQETK